VAKFSCQPQVRIYWRLHHYYDKLATALGEKGLVDVTIAVNAINSWNRIVKAFKPEVGSYKPQ